MQLRDLCFEVIQTCPNECRFCSSNSSKCETQTIPIEIFKKTIEHFMKQGGIQEISISGGEPFLHPDLFEMVRFCKEREIRTVIFTSGIKKAKPLTQEQINYIEKECKERLEEIEQHEPENARLKANVRRYYERMLNRPEFSGIAREEMQQLKSLGLDKIVFDWQAENEETDSSLMGRKNMFTYLMNSVIMAKSAGLNIDVHFVLMKPNYKQFPDILEFLELAKIPSISILNFVPQGRGRINREELMLNDEELQEFAQIVQNAKQNYSGRIRIGIPLIGGIQHLCTAGTEKLNIKYDGTVLACPAFKEISAETMEKYGIRLHNIYKDLEQVVVTGGKREKPLCKQIYEFSDKIALVQKGEER